ncbi:MAG: hypothetical protein B6D41_22490 [Chloroflexi bacterium UTCFX4]|nr:MAG: hypothetical protein B6D41_22490 [Chloroflexi bacterium UTCFX4]
MSRSYLRCAAARVTSSNFFLESYSIKQIANCNSASAVGRVSRFWANRIRSQQIHETSLRTFPHVSLPRIKSIRDQTIFSSL